MNTLKGILMVVALLWVLFVVGYVKHSTIQKQKRTECYQNASLAATACHNHCIAEFREVWDIDAMNQYYLCRDTCSSLHLTHREYCAEEYK